MELHGAILATAPTTATRSCTRMDDLDRFLLDQATTPMGGLFLFLAVFLLRITISELTSQKRRRPHVKHPKPHDD